MYRYGNRLSWANDEYARAGDNVHGEELSEGKCPTLASHQPLHGASPLVIYAYENHRIDQISVPGLFSKHSVEETIKFCAMKRFPASE